MRYSLFLASVLLVIPAGLRAQEGPGLELGTRAGLSVIMGDGDLVNFAIPGGAPSPLGSVLGGSSSVHLAFFPSSSIMIEPQLNFGVLSASNGASQTITTVGITGQIAYMFAGAAANSPYLGFNSSFFSFSNGESESDFSVGGNLGYRILVSQGAVLRLEGAYRRWFDLEINEINAAIILGVLFD